MNNCFENEKWKSLCNCLENKYFILTKKNNEYIVNLNHQKINLTQMKSTELHKCIIIYEECLDNNMPIY